MNRPDVIEYAINKMRAHNYMFSRWVGCEVLDSEWADFAVGTGTLKERPDKLWEVRFVLDPPAEDTADSRGALSVLINDATGEYGFYP